MIRGRYGRFRGKKKFAVAFMSVKELSDDPNIDLVQTIEGEILPLTEMIDVRGNVKTVFLNHKSVLLVCQKDDSSEARWEIIGKENLKNY